MMCDIIQVVEAGRVRWLGPTFRTDDTEQKINFFYLRNYQRNRHAKYIVVG
jgi:hypothetical protein